MRLISKQLAGATLVLATLPACKFGKKSKNESKISADSTEEVKSTAIFFKASWEQDLTVKFADLPLHGEASSTPYSGHWYPEATGGTNALANVGGSALDKYDAAFYHGINKSALWERRNHGTVGTQWAGHCNGFSAASTRHKEPTTPVIRGGVTFEANDIKALMAEIYMSANYFFLGGVRCENGTLRAPNPDLDREVYSVMGECEDVNPGTFHVALANWIGKIGRPMVFDEARYNQVWNYPLYKFASSVQEVSPSEALLIIGSRNTTYVFNEKATKFMRVNTTITYADALSAERAPAGTDPKTIDLEYILEIDATDQIIGGEWALRSRDDHPDFIWAPLEPMQGQDNRSSGNPYLNVQEVLAMWAESAGFESLAAAPKQLSGGTWASNWGKYSGFSVSIDGATRGSLMLAEKGNTLLITRDTGFPKIALDINSENVKEISDNKNVQTFTIKPVTGINWGSLRYTVNGKEESENLLMHALR